MHKAFEEYANAMDECVTEKLPALVPKSERVLQEADDVANNAEPQFEKLGLCDKFKAVKVMRNNMTMLAKIPSFMKKTLNDFKDELNELKQAIEELKNNFGKLKSNGKICLDK